MELLRSRYEEMSAGAAGAVLYRLLEGRVPAGQESQRAARLDIDLSGQAWTVSLVHIDGGQRGADGPVRPSAAGGAPQITGVLQPGLFV